LYPENEIFREGLDELAAHYKRVLELLGEDPAREGLEKTPNELIHIGHPIVFDTDRFLASLEDLMQSSYCNKADIRERVMEIVSTYHPA
jgi:GTP cyclohydrolase I